MDTKLPITAEATEAVQGPPAQREGEMQNASLPLPVAQRCEEIEEEDFALLVQIAENPEAPEGRPKRVPRKIPVTDPASTEK